MEVHRKPATLYGLHALFAKEKLLNDQATKRDFKWGKPFLNIHLLFSLM